MAPLVSVITATYNRSNILRYAIASVRSQTLTDWELIVVGDQCTDDTEAVVASFADPRIRFINLPENFGEQSGPNNVGLEAARGRFLAFLNHDDLWFPDHLSRAVETLEQTGAELVLAVGAMLHPDERVVLYGLLPKNQYDPNLFVPASGWVFRRELYEGIGGWRPARTLWVYPSYDWLLRVYRTGSRIAGTQSLSWLALPSGSRRNSYRDRAYLEHEQVYRQLGSDPDFRAQLLLKVSQFYIDQEYSYRIRAFFWQAWKNFCKRLLIGLGFVPLELRFRWKHRRKGDHIRALRQIRGLPTQD